MEEVEGGRKRKGGGGVGGGRGGGREWKSEVSGRGGGAEEVEGGGGGGRGGGVWRGPAAGHWATHRRLNMALQHPDRRGIGRQDGLSGPMAAAQPPEKLGRGVTHVLGRQRPWLQEWHVLEHLPLVYFWNFPFNLFG